MQVQFFAEEYWEVLGKDEPGYRKKYVRKK